VSRRESRRVGVATCGAVREKLYPYALMALDDTERRTIAGHLEACAACREGLEFVEARLRSIGAVQDTPRTVVGRRRGKWRRWLRWLALIPSVIAFAVLFFEGLRIARFRNEQRFLGRLDRALFTYHLDHGRFPPENEPLALHLTGADGGPYVDRSRERIDSAGHFLDSWGNPYQYTAPGLHNPRLFDLASPGPNGKDDGGRADDIANW